jgi:hypothetical protein
MNDTPSPARPRVTRDVDPSQVQDLLEDPPRAAVAFVDAEQVEIVPARARWADGVHAFAVRSADAPDLSGRQVVLIRDDGLYWFELRGVSVRGVARPRTTPNAHGDPGTAWYSIEPRRVLAWDYGRLRDV